MTNIVKRLRDANENDAYAHPWTFKLTCNEAADEIERLREALERIAHYPIPRPYFGKGGAIILEAMRTIARAYLYEQESK